VGLARRPSFHHKSRVRNLLLNRSGGKTPRRKDLRTEDSEGDVLRVVMVVVDVVVVVFVGEVVVMEVLDMGYLMEVEVVKD